MSRSERVIQQLLKENGATGLNMSPVMVSADGVEAAPGEDEQSPETYAGYDRAERFASPERLAQDSRKTHSAPARPSLNQWGLSGSWIAAPRAPCFRRRRARLCSGSTARDLHMVLGPAKNEVSLCA